MLIPLATRLGQRAWGPEEEHLQAALTAQAVQVVSMVTAPCGDEMWPWAAMEGDPGRGL